MVEAPAMDLSLDTVRKTLEQSLMNARRAPKGYLIDFDLAFRAPHHDLVAKTQRVFLQTGAKAFLALCITRSALRSRVHRKTAEVAEPLIPLLNLAIDDQLSIAAALEKIVPSRALQNNIRKLDEKLANLRERVELERMAVTSVIVNEQQSETSEPLQHQRHHSEAASPDKRRLHNEPLLPLKQPPANEQRFHRQINANISSMIHIFPQYLCSTIRKTESGAAITMSFPYEQSPLIHCLMSLSIMPDKLQRVADKLLGVNLEVDGGKRYLLLDNLVAVRILDGGNISLQGAHPDSVQQMLGAEVARAICTSPVREAEMREGKLLTSCVTMTISGNPDEDGQLNLNMGMEGGMAIRRQLYPHLPTKI